MDWAQFVVQWLHVITAITWFGAVIYNDFILIPGLMKLAPRDQRSAGGAIGSQADRILRVAATAVIILGILRGTVFGSIRSFDALTTTYGLTWLAALVLAVITYIWGVRFIGGALHRLNALDIDQAVLADGRPNPAMTTLIDEIKRKSQIELGLFLAIFTCMILMRFGY